MNPSYALTEKSEGVESTKTDKISFSKEQLHIVSDCAIVPLFDHGPSPIRNASFSFKQEPHTGIQSIAFR